MAERSLTHLNYGHPGRASFDIQKKEWRFSRQRNEIILAQIGVSRDGKPPSTEVIPPSIQLPNLITSTRATDATASVKDVIQAHSQLAAAVDVLPNLAVTSAAIVSTSAIYDPQIGDNFSTGSITFRDLWENPRRVAATISGELRNILRLSFFYKESQGWGNEKTPNLKGETLRDTECGYWNEDAAPIQQVCFSKSHDRSSLLAVRLPTRTVILRPFYTPQSRSSRTSSHYELPPSRIDAHPILNLAIGEREYPHADVTFNPDFQLQFAVIDQNCTWSIWDIEHGRKGDSYAMSCLAQGPLSDEIDLAGEDGWARIRWIGDVDTVLMCNRRYIRVVSVKAGGFQHLPCPELIAKRSSDWILGVEKHPTLSNRIFVLTTTTLFLMEVTTVDNAQEFTNHQPGARVLVSWLHYRGTEDFTLRMDVHNLALGELEKSAYAGGEATVGAEGVCVLLHSGLNSLVQFFNFNGHSNNGSVIVTSSNPSILNLAVGGNGYITNLALERLDMHGDVRSSIPNLEQSYAIQGLRFFKLLISRSDLSVHETLIYGHGPEAASPTTTIPNPAWITAILPRKYTRSAKNVADMDGFIATGATETMKQPRYKLIKHGAQGLGSQQGNTTSRVAELGALYRVLSEQEDPESENPRSISIATVIQQILAMLHHEGTNGHKMPIGTLLEVARAKLGVSDIDESSNILSQFLDTEEANDVASPTRIASPQVLHIGRDAQITLSDLYDTILQYWIASLPPAVSIRARQNKERLARRVAAEVIFASTRMRYQVSQAPGLTIFPNHGQSGNISIPILSSQPAPSDISDVGQWSSSQSLPTVDDPILPQSSQAALSSPNPQTPAQPLHGPLVRLTQHLKFRDDKVEDTPLASSLEQLLAHWHLGADPQTYDWERIQRSMHDEALDEESQQRREKERRRRERRRKKQQREDELVRTQPSSQPFTITQPTVFPRSSPGPTFSGIGNSSQGPALNYTHVPLPGSQPSGLGGFGSLTIQSQVEPGQYGGRPEKKKKKKRLSGF